MSSKKSSISKEENDYSKENYIETILNLIPSHIYWKDKAGVILGCNSSQWLDAGFSSSSQMIGKTDYEMPWKDQAEYLRKVDADVIKTGNLYTVEEPSTLASGKNAIFLSQKMPLRNRQGEIVGIAGISVDITELRETQKKLSEVENKLDAMTLLSASMAHELRNPLSAIGVGMQTIKGTFAQLVNAYKELPPDIQAKTKIDPVSLKITETVIDSIKTETQSGFTFIDMLLMNINPQIDGKDIHQISVASCVTEALERYPFKRHQQAKVHWQEENDFQVEAKPLLLVHVLFNLIRNALYHIEKSAKPDAAIFIWLEATDSENILHFKDTGTGIEPDVLPHIFERFFSNTRHGAGIGLSYCRMVMESLGGSIICESVLGDYTQFIITFPKI